MKYYCAALVMLSGLCTALILAGPPTRKVPAEAAVLPLDVQDVVYFAENRPALLRLHILVDGKPFRANFDAFVDQVFRYLDVDGDGVLNEREASRVPPAAVLFGGNRFVVPGRGGPAQPDFKTLDRDGDGKVSRAELASYYRDNGVTPFQVQTGANPNRGGVRFVNPNTGRVSGQDGGNAEALNKALFNLLDTNKDGKLSREELAAAPGLLMKLDANDDEMITPEELLREATTGNGDGLPVALAYGGMPAGRSDGSFFVIEPGCGPELARQLLIRYGKTAEPKPGLKLSREQLGLDAETFAALDTDRDGFLDAAELAKFADRAPDLEMKVRIGGAPKAAPPRVVPPPPAAPSETLKEALLRKVKKAQQPEEAQPFELLLNADSGDGDAAVEVLAPQGRKAPLADAVTTQPGGPLVQLGRTRLDFQPGGNGGGMGGISIGRPNLLQQYLNAFKAVDSTNKGYITEEEAKANPTFRNVFKLMDRDGDGKLYEKEIREYLSSMQSLESAAARACVTLNTSDKGRGLFDLIDTDHDGRLSVREMRQMTELLKTLDHDGKGAITRSDVPRNIQVSFQSGTAGGFGGGVVFVADGGFGGQRPQPATPRKGPAWFVKMDRNGDGDVSRREFLGTDAQFKEIDTDGDGLISLAEAEAYDRKMREKKDKSNP